MALFRITFSVLFVSAFAGAPSMVGAQTQNPDPPADEAVYQLEAQFLRGTLVGAAFGSYIDEQTKEQIVVIPADADARALEVHVRLSGNTPQRLQRATMSRAAQSGLERELVTRSYHPEAGKYSMATYFDLKSGKQLLVTDAPRHVTEQLEKRYPKQIDVRSGAIVSDASRLADRQLFSGAAGIKAAGAGYCTSAWKVREGTLAGVLAPGHCWGPYAPYHHFDTWDEVTGYGAMTTRSLNPDVGLIWWSETGDVYRPYIYTGGANSSTTSGVVGGRDPSLNQAIYYRTGAVTGQVAGITVTSLNATYVDQDGTTHTNAMAYTSATGSLGGDSGAPIYIPSSTGTTIHVRGFHTARATSGDLHFGERYTRVMTGRVLICASSSCYEGS
jgi:hypothetical protein